MYVCASASRGIGWLHKYIRWRSEYMHGLDVMIHTVSFVDDPEVYWGPQQSVWSTGHAVSAIWRTEVFHLLGHGSSNLKYCGLMVYGVHRIHYCGSIITMKNRDMVWFLSGHFFECQWAAPDQRCQLARDAWTCLTRWSMLSRCPHG